MDVDLEATTPILPLRSTLSVPPGFEDLES
ncbi:hypothetical protein Pan54_37360 [Rubinisphaera italica]|uniref:Uncharacterized protein n=1 Tax=Rubinisphaera italica TaxID=2527969 RepID=A0A5C5XLG2_9PLAN|nr:hypothetical protein Pan54_37360 [Rubinisphaera italica]